MKFKKLVTEKRALPGAQHFNLIISIIIILAILFWRGLPFESISLDGSGNHKVAIQILNTESSAQCFAAIGDWCNLWYTAPKYIAWKSPPRGNKSCLWNCNNAGVSVFLGFSFGFLPRATANKIIPFKFRA